MVKVWIPMIPKPTCRCWPSMRRVSPCRIFTIPFWQRQRLRTDAAWGLPRIPSFLLEKDERIELLPTIYDPDQLVADLQRLGFNSARLTENMILPVCRALRLCA